MSREAKLNTRVVRRGAPAQCARSPLPRSPPAAMQHTAAATIWSAEATSQRLGTSELALPPLEQQALQVWLGRAPQWREWLAPGWGRGAQRVRAASFAPLLAPPASGRPARLCHRRGRRLHAGAWRNPGGRVRASPEALLGADAAGVVAHRWCARCWRVCVRAWRQVVREVLVEAAAAGLDGVAGQWGGAVGALPIKPRLLSMADLASEVGPPGRHETSA